MVSALEQGSVGKKRIFFKEEANLIAGVEKIIVAGARLFLGREYRDNSTEIEIADEFFSPRAQKIAGFTGDKILEHEKSVALVGSELVSIDSHLEHHSWRFQRPFQV